jgi:DNA-binding MarR family transcriptional regulator
MNEIGKEMVVTFANITTIVDNLEKMKLVRRVRDTKDRRVIRVQLTPEGSSVVRRIYSSHRKQVAELMSALNKKELRDLMNLSLRIKEKISEQKQA